MTATATAQPCKQHKYVTTFDHTDITGQSREHCTECGMIRWTKDGNDEAWMPGQYVAPATNTEARQLDAELAEQPEPACAYCGAGTGHLISLRQGDGSTAYFHSQASACHTKTSQPDMFAARTDDLPLFSGTAPRATVRPYVETEQHPQPRLF